MDKFSLNKLLGLKENLHQDCTTRINGAPTSMITSRGVTSMNDDKKTSNKRYCLWVLTFLLTVVGLCNLLLSITVITVLRISRGMEALEIVPDENLIKFYGRTDLDKMKIQSGIFQGYGNQPMEITSHYAGVLVKVKDHENDERTKLEILRNGTTISQVQSFQVKDPQTGETYFSTDFPNFGLPSGVNNINVRIAETFRITSPVNESLEISSPANVSMIGAEGIEMESKDIVWHANSDIFLTSTNGNLIFNFTSGNMFIDIKKIPVVPITLQSYTVSSEEFKLCVCMPQGKIFKIPIHHGTNPRSINCARINRTPDHDPCLS